MPIFEADGWDKLSLSADVQHSVGVMDKGCMLHFCTEFHVWFFFFHLDFIAFWVFLTNVQCPILSPKLGLDEDDDSGWPQCDHPQMQSLALGPIEKGHDGVRVVPDMRGTWPDKDMAAVGLGCERGEYWHGHAEDKSSVLLIPGNKSHINKTTKA